MRNMLALAALVLLTFVGLGWYLDWYHIKRTQADSNGHQSVNIDINSAKILHDVHKGQRKIHKAVEKQIEAGATVRGDEKPHDGAAVLIPNE